MTEFTQKDIKNAIKFFSKDNSLNMAIYSALLHYGSHIKEEKMDFQESMSFRRFMADVIEGIAKSQKS